MSDPAASEVGWRALAPALIFATISTVVVVLRLITRASITRCLGVDDYLIIPSLLLSWTITALTASAKNEGLGVYNGLIHTTHLSKLLIASNVSWCLSVNLTKTSILAQYLRLFHGRNTYTLTLSLLAFMITNTLYSILAGLFLCKPITKLWHPDEPGTCWSAKNYWLSVAALNTAADLFVLILPLPAISSLRLPRREKVALLLVFTLGFLVCVTSSIRLAVVLAVADEGDQVMATIWNIILSAVEANVGIVCACSLALKPLLAYLWPGLLKEERKLEPALPSISNIESETTLVEDERRSEKVNVVS